MFIPIAHIITAAVNNTKLISGIYIDIIPDSIDITPNNINVYPPTL